MKIKNKQDVNNFINAVNTCEDTVYLMDVNGQRYDLKPASKLEEAIRVLTGENGDELELWCPLKDDQIKMLNFLRRNPHLV